MTTKDASIIEMAQMGFKHRYIAQRYGVPMRYITKLVRQWQGKQARIDRGLR